MRQKVECHPPTKTAIDLATQRLSPAFGHDDQVERVLLNSRNMLLTWIVRGGASAGSFLECRCRAATGGRHEGSETIVRALSTPDWIRPTAGWEGSSLLRGKMVARGTVPSRIPESEVPASTPESSRCRQLHVTPAGLYPADGTGAARFVRAPPDDGGFRRPKR
jgi:hypothetical protein